MVRCKFKCECINLREHGAEVIFSAVHTGSEENAKFFKNTPSGQLQLAVVPNDTATANFKPGQEFYLDITPA